MTVMTNVLLMFYMLVPTTASPASDTCTILRDAFSFIVRIEQVTTIWIEEDNHSISTDVSQCLSKLDQRVIRNIIRGEDALYIQDLEVEVNSSSECTFGVLLSNSRTKKTYQYEIKYHDDENVGMSRSLVKRTQCVHLINPITHEPSYPIDKTTGQLSLEQLREMIDSFPTKSLDSIRVE